MQFSALTKEARDFFAGNRRQIQRKLKNSALLLFGNTAAIRNNDVEYSFRQSSDFYYLTGCTEPDAVLLLDGDSEALFLSELSDHEKVWTGRQLEPKTAKKLLGIKGEERTQLEEHIFELFRKAERIYTPFQHLHSQGEEIFEAVEHFKVRSRKGGYAFAHLSDSDHLLHEARLVKKKFEIEHMRRALQATSAGFHAVMRAKLAGKNEAHVARALHYVFYESGGTDQAYPPIVAAGQRANVLHYIANNKQMQDGQLLLIDAGAEYNYYASDITRTFPVGTSFTKAQRELYDVVLKVQKKACADVKPGTTMADIHKNVVRGLTQGMLKLGILKGTLKSNIKDRKYLKYFMHGTGHWLGLDVHDQGLYFQRNGGGEFQSRKLKPGMVTTIEPGLYIPAGDKTVPGRFRGIGIRIEDDVLVTSAGSEILSADIPKEADELEELRAHQEQLPSFSRAKA